MRYRKAILLVAVVGALAALAAVVSAPGKTSLLLLDWAAKAKDDKPPVAVLIEMGLKDEAPTDWTSRAVATGAKVVHREGYRFRDGDKLIDPDGWEASTRHALGAKGQPAIAKMEGISTVGVVLHLADVTDDATLTIEPREKGGTKAVVAVKDLLDGTPRPLWDGKAVVRRVSTAALLAEDKTEDDFPAAAYGPDGTLWVAYIAYHVRDESRRIQQKDYKEQPENFKALYTPEYADQLFVKTYRDGKWSEPIAVTEADEDLMKCAVAVEGNGDAWVIYSAHRKDRFDLYARRIAAKAEGAPRPGPEERLSAQAGSFLSPVACTDQQGRIGACCQRWDEKGQAWLSYFACRDGKWTPGLNRREGETSQLGMTVGGANVWHPSIACNPSDNLAVAYDCYANGDYDIGLNTRNDKELSSDSLADIAKSPRFEARPSACYDPKGRLWIAYEEGPERWGKDYGALVSGGNPLYNSRHIRVLCYNGGKLMEPVAELPLSDNPPPKPPEGPAWPKAEKARRLSSPQLGLDGKGRLWLVYREKFGTRNSTHPGSYWLSFARRLDGDKWSEPIEIAHSDGLLSYQPALLPHPGGGLRIVHNTDGRFTTPEKIQNQVYVSIVDLPGDPVEPKLVEIASGRSKKDRDADEDEREAVRRCRDYRIEAGGKKYQLLRGEFHRHTEISWDGGPDGTLEDMFRYAIDAAELDWIGDGDHDNGAGREYPWWLIQKYTDAYYVADHFTPMFCYERSVPYPHGHRNCLFAKRGVRTLPRLAEEDPDKKVAGIHADDTKMLYRYLHELDGICASHTSATSMGTDWRDNDPAVEPLVEVYQGDRMSYEYQGAPRAGYDPKSGKEPANIAGWFPKGFINNAFDKGYKLGFEASSDHWSTHISYCVAVAEKHDRAGILAALKQRHSYAATDDIVLDVRSGGHIMGDAFKTGDAPALQLHVIGTGPLEEIVVRKDGEVVEVLKPDGAEYKGEWKDPKPTAGVHYYYVRVEQKDKALAWASPLWIEYAP